MKKKISILLIIVLVFMQMPVVPVLAEEKEGTRFIRDTKDFLEFAANCNSDSWSRGKTFMLTADIDLTGVEFEPIQVFAGTFDGHNHTISGIEYEGNGYAEGFFRFITQNGIVTNLTVCAKITSADKEQCTGGIVGVNGGTLIGCAFRGIVNGKSEVGGIAGESESGAYICDCEVYGSISGYDAVGGIVGKNFGFVTDCCNNAGVNSDDSWLVAADEGGLSWILENRSGGLPLSGTDIGGIAGYSESLIKNCKNCGVVGYEHNGYNIGGIAGRQSGQLQNCVNEGSVYGRKDVGGIVGQMEPYIHAEEAQSLSDSTKELHDRIDRLLSDIENAQKGLSGDFSQLREHSGQAVEHSENMVEALGDYAEENVDLLNDVLGRIDYVTEHLPEVIENINASVERVDEVSKNLKRVGEDLDIPEKLKSNEEDYKAYLDAKDKADDELKALEDLLKKMGGIDRNLPDAETPDKEISDKDILDKDNLDTDIWDRDIIDRDIIDRDRIDAGELAEFINDLSEAGGKVSSIMGYLKIMTDVLEPYVKEGLQGAKNDLVRAAENLSDVSMFLQIASELTTSILDYLNTQADVEVGKLGENFHGEADALKEELDRIKEITENLGGHMDDYSDRIIADFRSVNDQLNVVIQLLVDKINNVESFYLDEDRYEDVSREDIAGSTDGKVSGCKNTGTVAGNVNVGGIAGAMAIDEEDPEDNAAGAVKILSGGRYTTSCIIDGCENNGMIEAKKDGAGGIVGFMRLGLVNDCRAYGSIKSTEGEYIGGVCGQSLALIQNCWVLVSLEGNQYVGGVAGYGNKIHGCNVMAVINPEAIRKGAVAGWVESEENERVGYGENISNNYYVSGILNGVDHVNYSGVAEPVTYLQMLSMPDIPEEFQHLHIDFMSEGELVERVNVEYGQKISEVNFPQVPVINGSYGKWASVPFDAVEANLTVEAEYFDSIMTLKSSTEGQEKALAMADGIFTDGAQLYASVDTDDAGVTAYMVNIRNVRLAADTVTRIRVLNPYKEVASVEIYRDGTWENVDYREYGNYLEVTMTGAECQIRISEKSQQTWLYVIVAGAGAVCVLIILLVSKGIKRRKRKNT